MGRSHLRRLKLTEILPFGSPVLALIDQVRARGAAINEYQVDLGMQKVPGERRVDIHVGADARGARRRRLDAARTDDCP